MCACQAERELQPWIAKDDGQKIWRINQRIVKLIVELMRNHDSPESLVILASASDLLLRATDGMLVDGEACTLPQLEVTNYEFVFICSEFFYRRDIGINIYSHPLVQLNCKSDR